MIEENAQRRLADYLSEYAAGVVEEWMRIVEVDEDVTSPGSARIELRATWAGDGTFDLGTTWDDKSYGTYRLITKVELVALPEPEPAWIPSTFLHIKTGDRLRMGQEEALVVRCAVQQFHADNTSPRHPKPWDHWEVYAELDILPFQQYPSDTPVEILCDAERAAQLTLSTAGFVGTERA